MAHELVAHEVQHLIFDWVLTRKGMKMTEQNEERIATMTGEISRRIWRKYERWENAQKAVQLREAKRLANARKRRALLTPNRKTANSYARARR